MKFDAALGITFSGRLLHVGCGGSPCPEFLQDCEEVRLDVVDDYKPHIVANLLDMGDIGEYDIVYSSHVLEHVNQYQVQTALKEFHRVLKPGGFALMFVPNLDGVSPTEEVLYDSPAGPITGLDMFYGKKSLIEKMPYMAHHTGFVPATLKQSILDAGFSIGETSAMCGYNLLGIGIK